MKKQISLLQRRNENSERPLFNSRLLLSPYFRIRRPGFDPQMDYSVAMTMEIKLTNNKVKVLFSTKGTLINSNITTYCLFLSLILLSDFRPNLSYLSSIPVSNFPEALFSTSGF